NSHRSRGPCSIRTARLVSITRRLEAKSICSTDHSRRWSRSCAAHAAKLLEAGSRRSSHYIADRVRASQAGGKGPAHITGCSIFSGLSCYSARGLQQALGVAGARVEADVVLEAAAETGGDSAVREHLLSVARLTRRARQVHTCVPSGSSPRLPAGEVRSAPGAMV